MGMGSDREGSWLPKEKGEVQLLVFQSLGDDLEVLSGTPLRLCK